jgi:zinc transport system substrate-binding protein
MKSLSWKRLLVSLNVLLVAFLVSGAAFAAERRLVVLCSTFPIYQITRNVVQDSRTIKAELMLPSTLGCPHDYLLTPKDMQKIDKADVLVINGLGMDEFLEAPLKKANRKLIVIDSSVGIKSLLEYTEEEHDEKGHHEEEGHNHEGINPHLFVSPRMCALITVNIANGLTKVDPAGAKIYRKNAKTYADKMNNLADSLADQVKSFRNKNIVTQHGAFDYFARDAGLTIVAVLQEHPGQEPSASEMLTLIREIKAKKAGAVYYEPQYSPKIPRTIARETGIPAASLDPVATGSENAGLDYYEKIMARNMVTLKTTLGRK